jgi:hypothetical protein
MDIAESRAAPAARYRWIILLTGLVAMTAGCTFQYGLAYLIPALRQQGFSLELASTLVACPTIGLLLTLIAWGAAADRWGEQVVLASGLALAGAALGIWAGRALGIQNAGQNALAAATPPVLALAIGVLGLVVRSRGRISGRRRGAGAGRFRALAERDRSAGNAELNRPHLVASADC